MAVIGLLKESSPVYGGDTILIQSLQNLPRILSSFKFGFLKPSRVNVTNPKKASQ